MYNSPFKNKNIDKMNGTGKATTANAMMNGGPGDPPKKKGTATAETKLDTMMSIYESKSAEAEKMEGLDRLKAAEEARKISERIKATPGGVDALQSKVGYVGTGSESAKKLTTADISKMTGKSEEKVKKGIMRQTGAMIGERIRSGRR